MELPRTQRRRTISFLHRLGRFSPHVKEHGPSSAKIPLLSAPMSYALPLPLEIGIEEANGEDWAYGSGLGSDANTNRLLTECYTATSSYSGVNSTPLNGGG
ncbi:hypothetical protein RHGRI_037551 [Rhododendron griersonianum]|uniref:Uncharacterized protein n=1 Tax=Rhododendron griersonianum TaxID=479676 RepID=A0AAV6HSS9_9ERIC|nr:hypothetical protein RHGRI_037551 [Rhododendron griersonianum]